MALEQEPGDESQVVTACVERASLRVATHTLEKLARTWCVSERKRPTRANWANRTRTENQQAGQPNSERRTKAHVRSQDQMRAASCTEQEKFYSLTPELSGGCRDGM